MPQWFGKFRYSAEWNEVQTWREFADGISEIDDECVCFDLKLADCDVHRHLRKRLEYVPFATKALFMKRHEQREQRKLEMRYEKQTSWWQQHVRLMASNGTSSFKQGLENFEEDYDEDQLSQVDPRCPCAGDFDEKCDFHGETLQEMKWTKLLRPEFMEFWQRRERAKIRFDTKEEVQEQYQINLEAANRKKRPLSCEVPWFGRVSKIVARRNATRATPIGNERDARPVHEFRGDEIMDTSIVIASGITESGRHLHPRRIPRTLTRTSLVSRQA